MSVTMKSKMIFQRFAISRSSDRSASAARCAPCFVAGGRSPRADEIESAETDFHSAEGTASNCSVKYEAQAIAVVQPRQRKRTSTTRFPSRRIASFKMSPQTGLLTSTVASALGSSPAFRGLLKWSRTASLNMLDFAGDNLKTISPRNVTSAASSSPMIFAEYFDDAYFFGGRYFFSMDATTT